MGNIIKNLNHTAEEINDILASVSTKVGESELVNVKNDLNNLSTYVHEQFKKKTTLAEYGIEDANISETTITLGENSINVATSEGLAQATADLTALIEEKADKSALAVVENATKAGTVTLRAGKWACNVIVDGTGVNIPAYSSVVVRPSTRFYMKSNSVVGCDFRADTTGWTSMTDMFKYFGGLSIDVSNLNTSQVTNMKRMFSLNENLISLDLGLFNTSQVANMDSMFSSCKSLTSLNVSNFDTGNVTDMYAMFNGCESLKALDVSNFNTANVTNMSGMFSNCKSLTSLNVSNFNTAKVTGMTSMFYGCSALTSIDVTNFNTAKVTDMCGMFSGCESLTSLNVSNFDTRNVESIWGMFYGCKALTSLDVSNFNTAKVGDLEAIFKGCEKLTSLDISNFNTANVTTMSYMFRDCSSLESLNVSNFNTANVEYMCEMFSNCSSLTALDLSSFNTANVTEMNCMFSGCSSLTSLNVSSFDTSQVVVMESMFSNLTKFTGTLDIRHFNMSKVTDLTNFVKGMNASAKINMEGCDTSNVTSINLWNESSCWQNLVGLDFSSVTNNDRCLPGTNCPTIVGDYTLDDVRNNNLYTYRNFGYSMDWSGFPNLNVQSFLAVINGLKDLTGKSSLTLTLPSRIQSSLTDDDIAKATDKNWTIVWK